LHINGKFGYIEEKGVRERVWINTASEGIMHWIMKLMVVAALSLLAMPADAAEKIILGAVEDVVILPWGITVTARIDTGAATSSLDVCEYKVVGKQVTFTLADRCGGHKIRRQLLRMKTIHTSEGSDQRPIVMMDICLGSNLIKTHVTLNDRSKMEHPLLVGRRTLRGRYIVDVSRKNLLPPSCPGIKPDFVPEIK
jgi:hypothetical protein